MLTLFTTAKPFLGHIGIIQRNAIRSWLRLEPRPDVVLLGNDESTGRVARELGVQHIPDIATNAHGTPLLSDVLSRTNQLTRTPLACLVNCDIILLQEFVDGVARIPECFPRFLAVAQRLSVDINESLDFATNGGRKLREEILPLGLPGSHTAIDAFVFPVGTYEEVPPLVLGRAWFDQWLIKDVRRRGIPVVDVTAYARVIHQNHDYGHITDGQRGAYWGEEALQNLSSYGGVPNAYTLLSVTHDLRADGTLRRVRMREAAFVAKQALWDVLVRRTVDVRDVLRLRRKFWQGGKSLPNVR